MNGFARRLVLTQRQTATRKSAILNVLGGRGGGGAGFRDLKIGVRVGLSTLIPVTLSEPQTSSRCF